MEYWTVDCINQTVASTIARNYHLDWTIGYCSGRTTAMGGDNTEAELAFTASVIGQIRFSWTSQLFHACLRSTLRV
jgi:hypothetical protein